MADAFNGLTHEEFSVRALKLLCRRCHVPDACAGLYRPLFHV